MGGRRDACTVVVFRARRVLRLRGERAMARKESAEGLEDRDLIERSPDWLRMESFWEEGYDVDAYLSDLRTIVSHAAVGRGELDCEESQAKSREIDSTDRRIVF